MRPDRLVPWGVAAGLAGVLVAMAATGFPVLDGDAVTFVPNALSYARGDGLINPFWARAIELDPAGVGRMTWHGFMYPLVVAWLAPSATSAGIIFSVGLVAAVSLLVSTAAMVRVVDGVGPLLMSAVVVAVAAGLVGLAGRPETLCLPIVAVAVACGKVRGRWIGPALVGGCLGLLALTSPVLAIVAAALLVPTALPTDRDTPALPALSALSLGAAGVLLLGAWIYPWPVVDWILGLWRHASVAMEASAGSRGRSLVTYLILNPAAPLIGPLAALALARRIGGAEPSASPLSRAGAVLAAAGLGLLLWRRPEQVYYLVGLLPIWVACVAVPWPGRVMPRLVVGVMLLALASPLTLTGLQWHGYLVNGVGLREAQARFASLEVPAGARVVVTGALWVLSDAHAVRRWEPDAREPAEYLLVQQANSGQLRPTGIDGYLLTSSNFVAEPPRWLGLPIGRATKSYAFAVYRPADPRD